MNYKLRTPSILHTRVVTKTGGGPDKTILNSPRFLKELGYSSACVYLHPPEDEGIETLKTIATQSECPLITIPDKGALDFSIVRKLLKVCKENNVSIWHGHDYKTNALGLLLRRFHRMHLVTTVHGWGHQTPKVLLYYWVDRQAIRRHDHVICVSEDLYETCTEMGVPQQRCSLIQNAIDSEQFKRSTSTDEAKTTVGFEQSQFLIGAVGRLSDEKGFDLLIEAVTRLIEAGLNVGLAIIGEGVERERLEKQIAESGHSDRIQLLGYRSDTKSLYEAMDLYVLSSHREGLPNVVLEAMAMEVPVVATRIAGVPKLVQDRENGLLVEAGDVSQIETAIQEIMLNPELRERLTRNARKTIENEFSFSVRMEKVRAIYDKLLSNSTKP
ncbi:glycosyltransferase [Thalassoglobus polymorphus]|uniref:Alpha-D-kanosaminyltransferase n=1 Tax=Thalassoglobus polymorphus TaxID=2527994 RepID=A0A517QSR0_9PLAN|nr:glycosyltransferase [Thalassoglobus polymorphus]QDT34653.1 Alpha-D-kanosaminyltransferase [Thalassoglobus polymorphus]